MSLLDGVLSGHYNDPVLGLLVRGWGRWQGQIVLGDDPPIPLVLAGWRSAPDPTRLQLTQELAARYAALRPAIERALFEHYAPYGEAIMAGEERLPADLPQLARPEEVWAQISGVRVLIARLMGRETVEIAYRAVWDDEHTLAARFHDWALVELNGSVLV